LRTIEDLENEKKRVGGNLPLPKGDGNASKANSFTSSRLIKVQPISEPFNLNLGQIPDTGALTSPYVYDENEVEEEMISSPVLSQVKEVALSSPHKIEELEHSESDDDQVFEKIIQPSTSSRSQPKRSCNIGQNLAFGHCADENSSYQDHCEKESPQISDSGSNSDWYEY